MMSWAIVNRNGVAIYSFKANGKHQISLSTGDEVDVYGEAEGWYKGEVLSTGEKGIFPANYVVLNEVIGKPSASKDARNIHLLVFELTAVLHDWGAMLRHYFMEKKYNEFNLVKERLATLVQWRRELIMAPMSADAQDAKKEKILAKIEEGRKIMGLDYIPRNAFGRQADESNTKLFSLLNMHLQAASPEAEAKEVAITHRDTTALRTDSSTVSHIFLDLKACMCPVGENTELNFQLYNRRSKAFISETYHVSLTNYGMPHNVDLIGRLKTLFVDLSQRDLADGLYIVCRIVRDGKMHYEEKQKSKNTFRRPFGVAVLPINAAALAETRGQGTESIMQIYSGLESAFPNLHQSIIEDVGGYEPVDKAKGLCVGLKLFQGPIDAVCAHHAELSDVCRTYKLSFPDIILPGSFRSDLYVTLVGGDFAQDRKTSQRNVECVLHVVDNNGIIIKDAIMLGAGHVVSEYPTVVFYHNNNPRWQETVHVTIPSDRYQSAHLLFSFRHCSTSDKKDKSESTFSFAFLPLTTAKGTVIADGPHQLQTYKPLKTKDDPIFYLKPDGLTKAQVRKEHMNISVLLCSTKLTQDESLLDLLHWETYSGALDDILLRFTYIGKVEIIKFLREIFDAFFAILDQRTDELVLGVYNAIVSIIGMLVDAKASKFTNFRPVLDLYIQEHYKSTMAHRHLTACLKHHVEKADNPKFASKILPSVKAMEYIFKFIIASLKLYLKEKCAGKEEEKLEIFRKELGDLFKAFNSMMSRTTPEALIGAQTIALRYFTSIFEELGGVMTTTQISEAIGAFISSVHDSPGKKQLAMEKLGLISKVVRSSLFVDEEARTILIPTILTQINRHIERTVEEQTACYTIFNEMLDSFQGSQDCEQAVWAVRSMFAMLLPRVLDLNHSQPQSSRDPEKMQHEVQLLSAAFALLSLLSSAQITAYIHEMAGSDPLKLKKTLELFLTFLESFVKRTPYPTDWLVMRLFTLRVSLKTVDVVLPLLKSSFFEGDAFDISLWEFVMRLLRQIIVAPILQLENCFPSKRKLILSQYGDLRLNAMALLHDVWAFLDTRQAQFIPDIVGPFLSLVFVNEKGVREEAVALYFSLLEREVAGSAEGSFKLVEARSIDELNEVAGEGLLSPEFTEAFITSLSAKTATHPQLRDSAAVFLEDLRRFLTLLEALRTFPKTPEFEDERTAAILAIMHYLKETNRISTYITYIYQLCQSHVAVGNYTEAAYTVLLHASLLTFSDEVQPAFQNYPEESSRDRKIKLYLRAIDYFHKGQSWEEGIGLLEELRDLYESELFDFVQLGGVLKRLAEFYENIANTERFYPTYFRVGYYGNGFKQSLRNRAFIYRGKALEQLSVFKDQLQAKFPNAELMPTSTPPGEDILNSPEQHIQVYTVHASSRSAIKNAVEKPDPAIPRCILKHGENVNVDVFLYPRPVQKGTKAQQKENEFATLWIENSFMIIDHPFPCHYRRALIDEVVIVEVSPLHNAIQTVKDKNGELHEIVEAHSQPGAVYSSPFTMVLNGTVDAAVNGGFSMYKKAFFNKAYWDEHPEHHEALAELRALLVDQLATLDRGLAVHGRICSKEMEGLQHHLESFFAKMKQELTTSIVDWTPESEE